MAWHAFRAYTASSGIYGITTKDLATSAGLTRFSRIPALACQSADICIDDLSRLGDSGQFSCLNAARVASSSNVGQYFLRIGLAAS